MTVSRQFDTAMWWAGIVFVAVWGLTIASFPFYKSLPIGLVPILAGAAAALVVSRYRAALDRLLSAPSRTGFIATVTLVAFALRACGALVFPLEPANDHEMFYRLAASVVGGTGYGWGYGPTAFFPPGMPLVVAGAFALFGVGPVTAKLVGLAVGTALVPASFVFARAAVSERVGRWAAVLVASSPTLVVYSSTIGYEPLLAMLVLAWAALTSKLSRPGASWSLAAVVGLVCGVGTLVKPVCLLLPAISAAFWFRARGPAYAARLGAVSVLVMLAVVSPWTLRNWRTLGHPVLVSTNGGVVLYSANHSGSRGIATPVAPLPGEMDEVSRDRIRSRAAVEWITAHPLEFTGLMVPKAIYGWGTTSSIMSFVSYDRLAPRHEDLWKALLNVGWGAFFVWCALAAWRTRVWAETSLAPALVFVLYLFGVHLVYEALSRHHVTALPVLSVTAAAWLSSGTRSESARRQE